MRGLAVVVDVDATVGLPVPRRQLLHLAGLLRRSPQDRRTPWAMPFVLQQLARQLPQAPRYYLTAAPDRFAGSVQEQLRRDGYPSGVLLTAGAPSTPQWLWRTPRGKREVLHDLVRDADPDLRWVLVGDDVSDDGDLYGSVAVAHPGRVAAIALRQVVGADSGEPDPGGAGPPVVRAPAGSELLARLRPVLGVPRPEADTTHRWLLTGAERGNRDSALRACTTGNTVRRLVDGRAYYPVLARALSGTGPGDLVLLAGWRADADRLLHADGTTLENALVGAARRGAHVAGLLWRSHLSSLGYAARENRTLARRVTAAGGRVLLDQRVRPLGSQHQKLVVVRHASRAGDDVAFLGGIDLAHGRADDAGHAGDPQRAPISSAYGALPPWHDVHLEVRGPAVADAELVFRERWQDPAPLTRLPWHALPDRLHRLARTASPLPLPAPDPPAGGTCTVQLLRTYPPRRPAYPFATRGERSIARAYGKALGEAERIVYVEDQYLWSQDVARAFASALARAPKLHLIAVVPRYPDQERRFYRRPAALGHRAALEMVRAAGGERVQVVDVESDAGQPVYVHAKVCVIDDVWATVGSDNLNARSWTHDSELTAAVLDERRDEREPRDPGGRGDHARAFARQLRVDLMREHLGLDDDGELLDPDRAAELVSERVSELDAWYDTGCRGPRPAGRLRAHRPGERDTTRRGRLAELGYRRVLDPDGRPLGMRLRRVF